MEEMEMKVMMMAEDMMKVVGLGVVVKEEVAIVTEEVVMAEL